MNHYLLMTAAIATTAALSGCEFAQDQTPAQHQVQSQDQMQTKFEEKLNKEGINFPLKDKQKSQIWTNVKSELGEKPNKEDLKNIAASLCDKETNAGVAYGMRAANFIIDAKNPNLETSDNLASKILTAQCNLQKLRAVSEFWQRQQQP